MSICTILTVVRFTMLCEHLHKVLRGQVLDVCQKPQAYTSGPFPEERLGVPGETAPVHPGNSQQPMHEPAPSRAVHEPPDVFLLIQPLVLGSLPLFLPGLFSPFGII